MQASVLSHSEDRILEWLRRRSPGSALLGDDAAFLPSTERWAVTTDSQISGVHFPRDLDPRAVARRLVAVNLSDLAACGARPRYALLALATPRDFPHRRFLSAFLGECRRRDLELAGGDLARSCRLTAVLTLLGSRVKGGRWLRRSQAQPGERLWVGGTLGESAAGRLLLSRGATLEGSRVILPREFETSRPLAASARRAVRRHLAPQPQLELGWWLARRRHGAAIDISDGLARDLRRLCRESSVGARVEVSKLPYPRHFAALCERLCCDPLDLALGGGEDYVLLFSLPRSQQPPPALTARPIGQIVGSKSIRLLREESSEVLPTLGWDHLARISHRGS
jgi:thiamine-monophosphate kinase